MATITSFKKISQLPEMQQSSIDNNDLFLVSDHIGGKYPFESKKLQVGTYSNYIKAKVKTELTPQISSIVQQAVQDALTEALEEEVARIAEQVLQDELPDALSAALSGESFDSVLKDALDRISDGRKDDIVLVGGGNADEGWPLNGIP